MYTENGSITHCDPEHNFDRLKLLGVARGRVTYKCICNTATFVSFYITMKICHFLAATNLSLKIMFRYAVIICTLLCGKYGSNLACIEKFQKLACIEKFQDTAAKD